MKKLLYTLSLALLATFANAQVKIGSNPGTIGSSSNLEVEATNGNKTSVNKNTGQVTIQDGTQGGGKVFTSDANGVGSWVSVTQTSSYLTPTGTFTCPFSGTIAGSGLNTGLTVTISQAGWYYFETGYTVITPDCNDYALYLSGQGTIWRTYCATSGAAYMAPREQNRTMYLPAGTYPVLGAKTNFNVPTDCNGGNPDFYIRFVRLAL